MKKLVILILGARSDIGRAIGHRFAKENYIIQLAARNVRSLEADQQDLELRYGAVVTLHEFDALNTASHNNFVKRLKPLPDVAVSSIGYLGEQLISQKNNQETIKVMRSNYEGPASIIGELANKFEDRKSGTLIGISSVAGERGRGSNYIYGSAKSGFTSYLSGLRNRLAKRGVHVITMMPGFVDTKMTKSLKLPKILTASASDVAESIYAATKKKQDIVLTRRWWIIMKIILLIPEKIFKRLSL